MYFSWRSFPVRLLLADHRFRLYSIIHIDKIDITFCHIVLQSNMLAVCQIVEIAICIVVELTC